MFRIVNEESRRTVENPATRALREGVVVGLANHTLLIARDGTERSIDDSAAPIRDDQGTVAGVVLVFRDITDRRQLERGIADARAYAENIVATVREPLVVLDAELRVRSASRSFYRTFHGTPEETEGRYLYDLGNGQWDIPRLQTLLEEILPQNGHCDDFEVEHKFEHIGRRTMLLNARRIHRPGNHTELILLAIEDITERKQAEAAVRAQREWLRVTLSSIGDAVIVTDAQGRVTFLNPVAQELTGWQEEALAKELPEVFRIVHEATRRTVESPVSKVLREGTIVGLANRNTVLIRKDGREVPIDDSTRTDPGRAGPHRRRGAGLSRYDRAQAGAGRVGGFRGPLPAALRDGPGRDPDPRRRHGQGHGREPVRGGLVGLRPRGVGW